MGTILLVPLIFVMQVLLLQMLLETFKKHFLKRKRDYFINVTSI